MSESLDTIFIYVVAALLGIAILIPLLRKFTWWVFRFDKKVEKILQQKKSSEVRLGKITEALAPALDNFPVDISKEGTSTVFLGQPVDYIHFDPEHGITFIEVKSGDSRLNNNQKKIKELIEQGEVDWAEFRVS